MHCKWLEFKSKNFRELQTTFRKATQPQKLSLELSLLSFFSFVFPNFWLNFFLVLQPAVHRFYLWKIRQSKSMHRCKKKPSWRRHLKTHLQKTLFGQKLFNLTYWPSSYLISFYIFTYMIYFH